MVYSMTGYGKSTAEIPNKKITVEIRSLNSKQFDLSVRLPIAYKDREIALRNDLSRRLERGKIDLTITVELLTKDVSSKIDHHVVAQYYEEIKDIADELQIEEPKEWFTVLFRLPDVMKQDVEEISEEEWAAIEAAVEEAVNEVIAFRQQEGEMLGNVLREKIENIRSLLGMIDPYEAERIEKVKLRLYEGLKSLEGIEYDKNRFEQELIYYIEKLDISEEKERLANHLNYFIETLDKEQSQGRKLGFIAQEIGREINTMGSKSNHSEMQRLVVQMKDELEQIKEQVLNVL
ncbi:MAG TPA: YicC family protein [Dysgonamonadaceae bacterium]|jgi:uncharacterized protein (TIGR00255 family)|nr:YicC family protein [Dysgonamonadaceae bacterium]